MMTANSGGFCGRCRGSWDRAGSGSSPESVGKKYRLKLRSGSANGARDPHGRSLEVHFRPRERAAPTCSECRRKGAVYDHKIAWKQGTNI